MGSGWVATGTPKLSTEPSESDEAAEEELMAAAREMRSKEGSGRIFGSRYLIPC